MADFCQTLRFPSPNDRPGLLPPSRLVPLRLVVPGRRNSAVLLLLAPMRELQGIDLTGPSQADSHSVISVTNPHTADAMIIDPRGHHRPGPFEVVGMGIDRATGPRKGLTVGSEDDLDLPAPRMPEIVGIAAPARDRVVSMKERRTFQCLGGPHETCQRCRSSCWKKSIGSFGGLVL